MLVIYLLGTEMPPSTTKRLCPYQAYTLAGKNILSLWVPKLTYTYDKYNEVEMHSAMREYNKGIQSGSRESEKASQRK